MHWGILGVEVWRNAALMFQEGHFLSKGLYPCKRKWRKGEGLCLGFLEDPPNLPGNLGFSLTGASLFQDPNWYKAKNKVGREGIIPANYVQKREGMKPGIKLSLMP